MASSAAPAPSTALRRLQTAVSRSRSALRGRLEDWLEAERDQLMLWVPVAFGGGVAAWFVLPDAASWSGFLLAMAALALLGLALANGGRAPRALTIGALAAALGCALIWWRAEHVAAPVLKRPAVATFEARVERVEALPAKELVRVRLLVDAEGLPQRLRVNLQDADVPEGLAAGARIRLRARLMPPAPAAVPGAFDFARTAWFDRLGATGRGFAPVEVLESAKSPGADLRARLSRHIQSRIEGSAGGIASALATGDRGAISEEDSQAMQRSGLAHLLSVSGLHVAAVTGAAMFVVLRLLALSPWLALRWPLPVIAAGAGALAAIGYTWLTGAEVPTIRSCVAALLILAALVLGREALTLRLVAVGALVVLLLWPEAIAGPSFQLSFAAVTAIVALHEQPQLRAWFAKRDEARWRQLGRALGSLLLTGIAVELALMPIALFHFHKAGLYGALANIVAIPLTTFVIMPLEAAALLLDTLGLGTPLWWLTGKSLGLLLWLAHATANAPGSIAALPAMPGGAYGLMVAGGLMLALLRTRMRLAGLVPFALGALWALATPAPDLLVTGDGRHLALRSPGGGMAMLRDRAGDYTQTMLAENGGVDDELALLSDQPWARCSRDLCIAEIDRGGRRWRIAATRSGYLVAWRELVRVCGEVDIVVSERGLPPACSPRWLKLDRPALAKAGGVAISFADLRVRSVMQSSGAHPWVDPATVMPPRTPGRYRPEEPRR